MSVSPPRDGEAPPVAETPTPEDADALLCPRCATPHEPNQEYCLECGVRLPAEAAGVVPRLSQAWRRRIAWYPGDWIWPSLFALVIAALAGIGSAAFVAHDRSTPDYVNATSPVGSVGTTEAPPEQTTPTGPSAPATTRPQQPARPPAPSVQALTAWPARTSGWTVVLQSLPVANGRAFALAQARAAQHSGLTEVGILDSSKYSSLHPGYYVLFSGIHDSFDDADTAATAARSHGYRSAYARRITP
jgi:cell division septation protein DedD